MIATYPCPVFPLPVTPANPVDPSVSEFSMPPLSTAKYDQMAPSIIDYDQMGGSSLHLTASTYITTQVPNNSEIDQNPWLWMIITIVAVVVLIITCTCVLMLAIFIRKKRVRQGVHVNKGKLHIQDELSYKTSVKSYQSSISVKLKVRVIAH